MRAEDLARELGVSGPKLRAWLRAVYPRPATRRGTTWVLTPDQVAAARVWATGSGSSPSTRPGSGTPATRRTRDDSDEAYVIELCDELLGEKAETQHTFEWLVGDPGKDGRERRLPVDAFYPHHRLVVEYEELQHAEPNAHFGKPDVLTVSGVHRGEQRRRYDERRRQVTPRHGLQLLVVKSSDLSADRRSRLRRERDLDKAALRALLDVHG